MTSTIVIISQLVIAFGIYNVWLVRANRATGYRGGDAKNLEEEFRVYGLSTEFMRIVKVLKLTFATLLLAGIWYAPVAYVGALGMCVLMLSAVMMHLKVRDPIKKALPAASLLALSLVVMFSVL
ncbi:MAG: DoxX family protein [Pseudomonadota bacterium]|jgi:hypothetical protein